MSELFPEFQNDAGDVTINSWKKSYEEKYPSAMDIAAEKIYEQVINLKNAIPLITKEMVRKWVEDLIVNKTFNGLYFQKVILSKLSTIENQDYRLATPEEEAKGIDGFVGNQAYSIKPDTYKTMGRLQETIDVKMIYYIKKKTSLEFEIVD